MKKAISLLVLVAFTMLSVPSCYKTAVLAKADATNKAPTENKVKMGWVAGLVAAKLDTTCTNIVAVKTKIPFWGLLVMGITFSIVVPTRIQIWCDDAKSESKPKPAEAEEKKASSNNTNSNTCDSSAAILQVSRSEEVAVDAVVLPESITELRSQYSDSQLLEFAKNDLSSIISSSKDQSEIAEAQKLLQKIDAIVK